MLWRRVSSMGRSKQCMMLWNHWRGSYMKPAPPVTRMFFTSGRGSNRVLPIRTGACVHRSSVTYDLGFKMVEFLRSMVAANSLVVGVDGGGQAEAYVWHE